jgi:hypothetical protein
MQTLDLIFSKYNTDKGPGFHNYSRQYEKLLAPLRERPIRILEIGVCNGGSLLAWKDAFPNAQCIVGVDITKSCKLYANQSKSIFVEILDATLSGSIDILKQKYGHFDLILDDGSHRNDHVIQSFEGLFSLLTDGGIYIVEDTICYKLDSHINTAYPNHIDYFTQYIPYLNQWRFDSTTGIKDHCIDPFKIQKKTNNIFERTIDKIEFGCSYIAIFKQTRYNWV